MRKIKNRRFKVALITLGSISAAAPAGAVLTSSIRNNIQNKNHLNHSNEEKSVELLDTILEKAQLPLQIIDTGLGGIPLATLGVEGFSAIFKAINYENSIKISMSSQLRNFAQNDRTKKYSAIFYNLLSFLYRTFPLDWYKNNILRESHSDFEAFLKFFSYDNSGDNKNIKILFGLSSANTVNSFYRLISFLLGTIGNRVRNGVFEPGFIDIDENYYKSIDDSKNGERRAENFLLPLLDRISNPNASLANKHNILEFLYKRFKFPSIRLNNPIGENLYEINSGVFDSYDTTTVELPETIREFKPNSFKNVKATTVDFSKMKNLHTIGSYSFENANMESLQLKGLANLKSIGEHAFKNSPILSLNLEGVRDDIKIEKGAFESIRSGAKVWVSPGSMLERKLLNKDFRDIIFGKYKNIYISKISNSWFNAGGGYLTKLVGLWESERAKNYTKFISWPPNLEIITKGAFESSIAKGKLNLSLTKIKSIGEDSFKNCTFDLITIPNSINSIGDRAFNNSLKSTKIEISEKKWKELIFNSDTNLDRRRDIFGKNFASIERIDNSSKFYLENSNWNNNYDRERESNLIFSNSNPINSFHFSADASANDNNIDGIDLHEFNGKIRFTFIFDNGSHLASKDIKMETQMASKLKYTSSTVKFNWSLKSSDDEWKRIFNSYNGNVKSLQVETYNGINLKNLSFSFSRGNGKRDNDNINSINTKSGSLDSYWYKEVKRLPCTTSPPFYSNNCPPPRYFIKNGKAKFDFNEDYQYNLKNKKVTRSFDNSSFNNKNTLNADPLYFSKDTFKESDLKKFKSLLFSDLNKITFDNGDRKLDWTDNLFSKDYKVLSLKNSSDSPIIEVKISKKLNSNNQFMINDFNWVDFTLKFKKSGDFKLPNNLNEIIFNRKIWNYNNYKRETVTADNSNKNTYSIKTNGPGVSSRDSSNTARRKFIYIDDDGSFRRVPSSGFAKINTFKAIGKAAGAGESDRYRSPTYVWHPLNTNGWIEQEILEIENLDIFESFSSYLLYVFDWQGADSWESFEKRVNYLSGYQPMAGDSFWGPTKGAAGFAKMTITFDSSEQPRLHLNYENKKGDFWTPSSGFQDIYKTWDSTKYYYEIANKDKGNCQGKTGIVIEKNSRGNYIVKLVAKLINVQGEDGVTFWNQQMYLSSKDYISDNGISFMQKIPNNDNISHYVEV